MSRWKMNKLGFLNFWLYDQEEFSLQDGHILLRGNNAAGKSITTQSFVPFILDGDRRPERLDPFGSRDRKMEFYLLGDNEREESTGYLYLEFRKPGTEEYRTIGVGMRAQRGKSIDFWGFCLRDGRRISQDGLRLYEKMDNQNLPLSKQKLRKLIGDPSCWAESQTAYKEMVNGQIFGFEGWRLGFEAQHSESLEVFGTHGTTAFFPSPIIGQKSALTTCLTTVRKLHIRV